MSRPGILLLILLYSAIVLIGGYYLAVWAWSAVEQLLQR